VPSVTRDRKKYGAPTVYSNRKLLADIEAMKESDQAFYRAWDHRRESLNEGSDVGRVYPLIEEDQ
jgi:hypothetical protein